MPSVETSIVIRAFNEEVHLPALLQAIRRQTYQDHEVIVVDSGSYDGTPKIAVQHGARLVRIESRDFTFGYSLNVGIRHSSGRFIAIVSAHTLPVDAEWLQRLVAPLRDPAVAMVYGKQLGTEASKFSEIQDFYRTFSDEGRVVAPPDFFANNANSAIRKDLWEQHSFDEVLPGLEDIAWAKHWVENQRRVVYEPRAAIFHIHNETWRQIRRRYYREALSAKWIGIRSRRHIPGLVMQETRYLASDLLQAARARCLGSKFEEIVRFRLHKAAGSVHGIWDGAAMHDPRRRETVFFDKCYKAVVIRAPGHAALEELELPEVKPGDVLVKVAYAGAGASDLRTFDGELEHGDAKASRYPLVPGRELSGVVARVGSNVTALGENVPVVVERTQSCGGCEACRAGEVLECEGRRELGRSGTSGAYGEYLVVPGKSVHRLPEDTDLKKAALCESVAEVLRGLRRLRSALKPASQRTYAVVGGGPAAHLCALVLRSWGLEPRLYARDPQQLALLGDPGLAVSADIEELERYAVVVETTGSADTQNLAIQASQRGASLLFLGDHRTKSHLDIEALVRREKILVFSAGSETTDLREAIDMLPHLELGPLLQPVVPLKDYKTAWKLLRERPGLRLLIEVDPELQDRPASGRMNGRANSAAYLAAGVR